MKILEDVETVGKRRRKFGECGHEERREERGNGGEWREERREILEVTLSKNSRKGYNKATFTLGSPRWRS